MRTLIFWLKSIAWIRMVLFFPACGLLTYYIYSWFLGEIRSDLAVIGSTLYLLLGFFVVLGNARLEVNEKNRLMVSIGAFDLFCGVAIMLIGIGNFLLSFD